MNKSLFPYIIPEGKTLYSEEKDAQSVYLYYVTTDGGSVIHKMKYPHDTPNCSNAVTDSTSAICDISTHQFQYNRRYGKLWKLNGLCCRENILDIVDKIYAADGCNLEFCQWRYQTGDPYTLRQLEHSKELERAIKSLVGNNHYFARRCLTKERSPIKYIWGDMSDGVVVWATEEKEESLQ